MKDQVVIEYDVRYPKEGLGPFHKTVMLCDNYGATMPGELTTNGSISMVASHIASYYNTFEVTITKNELGYEPNWTDKKSIGKALMLKYLEMCPTKLDIEDWLSKDWS
jgi:hypothetical protein